MGLDLGARGSRSNAEWRQTRPCLDLCTVARYVGTMHLDVTAELRRGFPGATVSVLDVDEVLGDELVVSLADLQADRGDPFLWATAFGRYDNGWFDIFSTEGDGLVYTHVAGRTICIVAVEAPEPARRCRVEILGQVRERPSSPSGYLIAGFHAMGELEPEMPVVTFL